VEATTKFKVGQTYWGRFITDADSRVEAKIERRTAKSVWIADMFSGDIERRKIYVLDGVERFAMNSSLRISSARISLFAGE